MAESGSYAQTNIQFLNQARLEGYAPGDLALFAQAYRFSLPLFSGRFRVSGKTFFAHLVGTASVLARLRLDRDVVAAGLLHAAYTHGDFGDGRRGISDAKRSTLRAAVGEGVEGYIARYTTLDWSAQSVPRMPATLDTLDHTDRQVITIRLANELDEYLDLGILYEGGSRQRVIDHTNRTKDILVQIALGLAIPQLARELARVFDAALAADLPPSLIQPSEDDESFVVPPASYRRLMEAMTDRLGAKSSGGA